MSAGRQGKATNWQDDALGTKILDERQAMWGEIPGEIVSFDAAKQTATIKPLYKPKFNGKPVDMPELLEVPVRFTRMGGFVITTPVKPGNRVTLRPQMRSSENYHLDDNGEASDARSFNLSDMEAHLAGGESLTGPIGGFNSQNMEIRTEGGLPKIEMIEGGGIKLIISAGCYIEMDAGGIKLVAPRIDLNP